MNDHDTSSDQSFGALQWRQWRQRRLNVNPPVKPVDEFVRGKLENICSELLKVYLQTRHIHIKNLLDDTIDITANYGRDRDHKECDEDCGENWDDLVDEGIIHW